MNLQEGRRNISHIYVYCVLRRYYPNFIDKGLIFRAFKPPDDQIPASRFILGLFITENNE